MVLGLTRLPVVDVSAEFPIRPLSAPERGLGGEVSRMFGGCKLQLGAVQDICQAFVGAHL